VLEGIDGVEAVRTVSSRHHIFRGPSISLFEDKARIPQCVDIGSYSSAFTAIVVEIYSPELARQSVSTARAV
jgi:hypothetical protein